MHPLHRLLLPLLFAATAHAQPLYDIDTIRTFEVTVQSDWRTVMANNYATKTFIKADVKIDGIVYKDVGVRHRGFSTYRFLPVGKTDKRPWEISLDEYVPGQNVQGYDTLNINNNVWDPSFVREVAAYEFMRRYTPSPLCCYVKMKVNGEDLGLFVHTQQIDKNFLEEWFEDDAGNRYRGERNGTGVPANNTALTWLGTNQANYQVAYELKTETGPYAPWVSLIGAVDVLNNRPLAQLPADLPKVLDVDNALRFLAAGNITAWLDSYIGRVCHNFYLYEDVHHGRLTIQPWDLNNSFGGLTDGLGTTGVARMDVFYRAVDTANPRPLFGRIVQVPEWRARYLAHYRTMLPEFAWSRIGARIDQLRRMIRPDLTADTKAIYTMTQFDQNLTMPINVGFVTVPGLQPFFQDRNAYLASHAELNRAAPALASLAHSPVSPLPQQPVTVTVAVSGAPATAVTLYYRTRGPFLELPMYDDGLHGDGAANDGVHGAAIPPQPALAWVQYYAGASGNLSSGGATAFLPPLAELAPPGYRVRGQQAVGPIVLSELLADNENGIRDEANELEDWFELTNTGQQPVAISGMYLTDNVGNPTKWQIPPGYTLQPGQTLLVWADEDGAQGPLHANFKLSADGEDLALFDTDGKTNLDWIQFGAQPADLSTGRIAGFANALVTFPSPTPRQSNRPEPCGHLPYGAADPAAARIGLTAQGSPGLGQTVQYTVSRAAASSSGVVLAGIAPVSIALPGFGPLLVDLQVLALVAPIQTGTTGSATLPLGIPNLPGLPGHAFYFQAFVLNGASGDLSNAVATRICP
jgi:hypothetical protein